MRLNKIRYSYHAQDALRLRAIKEIWCELTLKAPQCVRKITSNEVHYFATIAENANRCLKVVYNPTDEVVITLYFDRDMRKKECKCT